MKAMAPWSGMTGLKREMDELLERFFEPRGDLFAGMGDWRPQIDVSETKDAIVVKAEVPGIEPKEIAVTLEGDVLTIKGEKRQEQEEKDEKYYRVERSYGGFARSFRLPVAVDAGKVAAAFKNGVVTVTLPKSAAAKGTTIPIKEA